METRYYLIVAGRKSRKGTTVLTWVPGQGGAYAIGPFDTKQDATRHGKRLYVDSWKVVTRRE